MKRISTAGNTIVPAVRALEQLGFTVRVVQSPEAQVYASRGEEEYFAQDPETVLGLIKLVEVRSWDWGASEAELEDVMQRHPLL